MKALYRNKKSGDIFAIDTDPEGTVLGTSGPLFGEGFDPTVLDYDEYWNTEVQGRLGDFERISKDDYLELLRKNGFFPQITQRYLFE